LWKFAQARLLQIQQSVKRLKFSKVGNKKDSKRARRTTNPTRIKEEEKTERTRSSNLITTKKWRM
jgi:hypothetical protein